MTDLIMSLMWLNAGNAEGNPLFAWFASYGAIPFACGKLIFLFGPIGMLEYARKKHPVSAEQGTWVAVLAYVAFLALHMRTMMG